jgi:hypothetical protein
MAPTENVIVTICDAPLDRVSVLIRCEGPAPSRVNPAGAAGRRQQDSPGTTEAAREPAVQRPGAAGGARGRRDRAAVVGLGHD